VYNIRHFNHNRNTPLSTDDIETIKAQIEETEQTAAQLRAELESRRQAAKSQVIEEIRARMAEYGISADELGKKRVKKAARAEIGGYRDIETGQVYTGKGKRPTWLNARLAQTGLEIGAYREQYMARVQ
jgi:DNA-binding protein H-NS